MDMYTKKNARKIQILEALETLLEKTPGEHMTTARLAKQTGVSEAALYRHFPSKAKMLEGLIEKLEREIFSNLDKITHARLSAVDQCGKILETVLRFVEYHPGIARLLIGDVLTGETRRLRVRMTAFYDQLTNQLLQILQQNMPVLEGFLDATTQMMIAFLEGLIFEFVRSNFVLKPMRYWVIQWQQIKLVVLSQVPNLNHPIHANCKIPETDSKL